MMKKNGDSDARIHEWEVTLHMDELQNLKNMHKFHKVCNFVGKDSIAPIPSRIVVLHSAQICARLFRERRIPLVNVFRTRLIIVLPSDKFRLGFIVLELSYF